MGMHSKVFNFYADRPERVDKLLADHFPTCSRHYLQQLIGNRWVTVSGLPVKKNHVPKEGERIQVCFLSRSEEERLLPQDIPLEIVYEDPWLIGINKPAGMLVHPTDHDKRETLANALSFHYPNLPYEDDHHRPGIVHRLDKETSGILIVAKTLPSYQALKSLFQERKIEKEYLAICVGCPGDQTVEIPIRRHPTRKKEMATSTLGKPALTKVLTLRRGPHLSWVQAKPLTGRTHQIRLHLRAVNAPVLGDKVYGQAKINRTLRVERQLLHAHRIRFPHPFLSTKWVDLKVPIPQDFCDYLSKICN